MADEQPSINRSSGNDSTQEHDIDETDDLREQQIRPGYALRQSPLVQPVHMSAFTTRTRARYGIPDLAHEWVTLFQAIGGNDENHNTRGSKYMKIMVPDTVFLSPTGYVFTPLQTSENLQNRF